MYFLNKFCCICLNGNKHFKLIYEKDCDGVSLYNKLTTSIAEMDFEEMNDQRYICEGCCVTLNTVYDFRRMCLRNKASLIKYVAYLQKFSLVSGTICVRLKDINNKVIISGKETEIKHENEETDHHPEENCLQNVSGLDDNETVLSVKREYEIEDYVESDRINKNAEDNTNDIAHSDVKIEEECQTKIEDEFSERFEEVYISCDDMSRHEIVNEENPLVGVKEECFTQAPPDGSTSQTDGVADAAINNARIAEKNQNIYLNNHRERSHKCEICKKYFRYNCELASHMRIHSGVKPFECEVCRKKFTKNSDLNRHMLIHSGERPYECSICWRKFTKNSDLTIHMRIHSGEKPYECNVCKKKFIKKSDLTRHLRTHSNERPYECEICKKRFTQPNIVTNHMRLHSGERPHECEVCNRRFTQMKTLTSHRRIHTEPHECEICKKKFIKNSDLVRHVLIHSTEK